MERITADTTVITEITVPEYDIEYLVSERTHCTLVILARNITSTVNITVRLGGREAWAHILGIVENGSDHRLDLRTNQVHESPDGTSDLMVKSVLTDVARFSYSGSIRVERNAQKTNAYQRNENLMLSTGAVAESNPMLEILANDVRCTHGATISTIDPEQEFYLMSRGLPRSTSRQLIVDGFIRSVFDRIEDPVSRRRLEAEFSGRVYSA